MLNIVAIMGRLTADPELRSTQTGKKVCGFTVACNRTKDITDFFECSAWDKTAEFICQYFRKGQMIAVNGNLENNSFTDKNGNKRTVTRIHAAQVNFCGEKGESKAESVTESKAEFSVIDDSGDLPF